MHTDKNIQFATCTVCNVKSSNKTTETLTHVCKKKLKQHINHTNIQSSPELRVRGNEPILCNTSVSWQTIADRDGPSRSSPGENDYIDSTVMKYTFKLCVFFAAPNAILQIFQCVTNENSILSPNQSF